jgi:hypothetical protein
MLGNEPMNSSLACIGACDVVPEPAQNTMPATGCDGLGSLSASRRG